MEICNYFSNLKTKLYKIYKRLKIKFRKYKNKLKKYRNKNRKKFDCIFLILLSICILLRVFFCIYDFNSRFLTSKNSETFYVKVIRIDSIKEDKISYLVKLQDKKSNNKNGNNSSFRHKYRYSFLLNIYKDEYFKKEQSLDKYINFKYGDILRVSGKIVIPKLLNNPYEFDYKKYLNSNNIYGTLSTYNLNYVGQVKGDYIFKTIYNFKNSLSDKLYQKLPKTEANLLKSMVYGDDVNLDQNIKQDFQKIGISHLIAVSGSNVAIILLVFSYICDNFNLNKKIKTIFSIFLICFFCIFSDFELSLVRASIMAITTLILSLKNKKIKRLSVVIFSFLIIFVINPYSIFNVGMQFSYLAILGIILAYKTIYSFVDSKVITLLKINILYMSKNKLLNFLKKFIYFILSQIYSSFCFTFSVLIFTFPVQVYCFNTFTFSIFLSNFLVGIVMVVQEMLAIFSVIFINTVYIGDIVINANFVLLRLIIDIAKYISNLNIPVFNIQSPSIYIIFLYYSILFLIHLKSNLYKKLKTYTIYIKLNIFKKIKIHFCKSKYELIKLVNLSITMCVAILFIWYIYTYIFENYIYYFNVGQGNMALIHYKGKNIIIDCGSTDKNVAANIMNTFLKAKAQTTISAIYVTHFHSDHVNGVENIAPNFKIQKLCYLIPKINNVSEYDKFQKVIKDYNISSCEIMQFDKIEYLKDLKIYVLSPSDGKLINDSDLMNAESCIFLVCIKDKNYLFMGDATKNSEIEMLNDLKIEEQKNQKGENDAVKQELLEKTKSALNKIEVLQVGHHGSKTSTSYEFLNSIKVKEAVISAKKEKYGHPNQVTLDSLKKYNIKIKITELDGAIKFNI